MVNQGPDYTGPGIMVPYRDLFAAAAYASATNYPYVPGYGYGAHQSYRLPRPVYRPHVVAYRERFYGHPHYYAPMPRMRPTGIGPLGVRG